MRKYCFTIITMLFFISFTVMAYADTSINNTIKDGTETYPTEPRITKITRNGDMEYDQFEKYHTSSCIEYQYDGQGRLTRITEKSLYTGNPEVNADIFYNYFEDGSLKAEYRLNVMPYGLYVSHYDQYGTLLEVTPDKLCCADPENYGGLCPGISFPIVDSEVYDRVDINQAMAKIAEQYDDQGRIVEFEANDSYDNYYGGKNTKNYRCTYEYDEIGRIQSVNSRIKEKYEYKDKADSFTETVMKHSYHYREDDSYTCMYTKKTASWSSEQEDKEESTVDALISFGVNGLPTESNCTYTPQQNDMISKTWLFDYDKDGDLTNLTIIKNMKETTTDRMRFEMKKENGRILEYHIYYTSTYEPEEQRIYSETFSYDEEGMVDRTTVEYRREGRQIYYVECQYEKELENTEMPNHLGVTGMPEVKRKPYVIRPWEV